MVSVSVTLACERYDRTEALRDGRVAPAGVDLTYLPQRVAPGPGRTLDQALVDGEIDALYSPRTPRSFSWRTRRLFEPARPVEEDYYRRTLQRFRDYAYAQGLAARRLRPEDLFAPETLQSAIV